MNTLPTSDFNPSLRNTNGNDWEASASAPVIGLITVYGNGWEEARLKLWLVLKAVEALSKAPCKDIKEWTDDEWRSALKAMHLVMCDQTKH